MRISDWSSDVCSSDLGQQDSRLQRYATIVAQLSAQRMHTSAQCFIWASSPMRSHDCAHLRQTSAQVQQITGDTLAPVSMASASTDERRVGQRGVSSLRTRRSADKSKNKKTIPT